MMADNYLERRKEEYEDRKARWLNKGKHTLKVRRPERPDDESL